jgi:hypothetical protein
MRSGNLTWMYNALYNAEQMLPHLEPVELPDPYLPNVDWWVSVYFEACSFNGKLFPEDNYPCKVMAMVPKGRNVFLEETGIVVQSEQACTGKESALFVEWELMDGYHVGCGT